MKRSREVTLIYYRRSVKQGKRSDGNQPCPLCGEIAPFGRSEKIKKQPTLEKIKAKKEEV
jgi:hypothetical protein